MSTWDLRGDRNMTASRAGTSTPSDKQRALDRIRQDTDVPSDSDACRVGAGAPRSPESQDSRPLRSIMFMEPSTWRTSTEPSRF